MIVNRHKKSIEIIKNDENDIETMLIPLDKIVYISKCPDAKNAGNRHLIVVQLFENNTVRLNNMSKADVVNLYKALLDAINEVNNEAIS